MNKRNLATLCASVVALGGLSALALWFGALGWLKPDAPQTAWTSTPRIEMMPPGSPEYLERHYPGPNGKDVKTEIVYDNGDTGVKLYREDNTLSEWSIDFAHGGRRLYAKFAEDGKQVVLGYEYRDDRTLQWKTQTKGDVAETTTYYFDGRTVYSVLQRAGKGDSTDARYFRKNGKPWIHQVYGKLSQSSPTLEEVWDNRGNRVYVRQAVGDDSIEVTYYRADGTASYKQKWGPYTSYGYPYGYGYPGYPGYGGSDGEGGEYQSTRTVLKSVTVFAADGKTVAREIERSDDGSSTESVKDYAADGTSKLYALNSSGDVVRVESFDKDGKSAGSTEAKPGEIKIEVPAEQVKDLPTAPKANDFWKDQEKNVRSRQQDAP